jgi:uncharacterized membrane protein
MIIAVKYSKRYLSSKFMTEEKYQNSTEKQVSPNVSGGQSSDDKTMIMAILAYILFFIPIITGDSKKNEFIKYHVKQGFALFVVSVSVSVVGWLVPVLVFFMPLLQLATFVLLVVGVVNVAGHKKNPLPVIGRIGDLLKI